MIDNSCTLPLSLSLWSLQKKSVTTDGVKFRGGCQLIGCAPRGCIVLLCIFPLFSVGALLLSCCDATTHDVLHSLTPEYSLVATEVIYKSHWYDECINRGIKHIEYSCYYWRRPYVIEGCAFRYLSPKTPGWEWRGRGTQSKQSKQSKHIFSHFPPPLRWLDDWMIRCLDA